MGGWLRAAPGSPGGKGAKTLRHKRFTLVVDVRCVLTEPQPDAPERRLPR